MATLGALAVATLASCQDEPVSPGDENGGGDKVPPEMLEGVAEVFLIDDFDDGDNMNELGGAWVIYDDVPFGGVSETTPLSYDEADWESGSPGYGGTGFAAHFVGKTGNVLGFDYVGFDMSLGPDAFCPKSRPTEIDLGAYDGVQFMAKGTFTAGSMPFKIPHLASGEEACESGEGIADTLTDWADYTRAFNPQLTEDWSLIRIRFKDMIQPSWGTKPFKLSEVLANAKLFTWEFTGANAQVDLWLDSVALFKDLPLEPLEGRVVDDFEDGDHLGLLEGAWQVADDAENGGRSLVSIATNDDDEPLMDGEGYESERSFHLSYELDQGELTYDPYVYWWVGVAPEGETFDASGFAGISYWFKGSAHAVQIMTTDVEDTDFYRFQVREAEEWTRVDVPFRDLAQKGYGALAPFQPSNTWGIGWVIEGDDGLAGDIWIDDLMFVDSFPNLEEEPPDLAVLDAEPPAKQTIDSIAIDTPLQTLAMNSLSRGYNLTNWLEEGPFDDFETYNEEFVANLAAAGFQALRLPIDLDLYIEDREAFFAGEGGLDIDPTLFTILDSFAEWTDDHGLSLTIDYHQYDGSMNLSDPLDVEAMLGLWSAVAEHFADTTREDLFFELLNEPEQSGNVSSVDQDTWTLVADQAIAAIREYDEDRVLIFGDVNWNKIGPLVTREPFEDDRVIYTFHFYEPFVFTHQGATWSDTGTLHDIPYPYSPEEWSEYSRDLGLHSPRIPSWVLSAANAYYREGNQAALYNQIVEAKRWAVEHQVPVICNEFGAFDRASSLEDRANYLRDMTDILAELEIPWSHWFMVMDAETGDVNTEIADALGLD